MKVAMHFRIMNGIEAPINAIPYQVQVEMKKDIIFITPPYASKLCMILWKSYNYKCENISDRIWIYAIVWRYFDFGTLGFDCSTLLVGVSKLFNKIIISKFINIHQNYRKPEETLLWIKVFIGSTQRFGGKLISIGTIVGHDFFIHPDYLLDSTQRRDLAMIRLN